VGFVARIACLGRLKKVFAAVMRMFQVCLFFGHFIFQSAFEGFIPLIHIFYTGRQTAAVGFVSRTACSGRLKKVSAVVMRMF